MKIIRIEVSAEQRFNDPFEQFRNHCPRVTLTAEISEHEDPASSTFALQAAANSTLERERLRIIEKRQKEYEDQERQNAIIRLEQAGLSIQRNIKRFEAVPESVEVDSDSKWRAEQLADLREQLRQSEEQIRRLKNGELIDETDIPF